MRGMKAIVFGAVATILCSATSALAQPFPSKPIHIVIPFGTGLYDSVARTLGDELSKILKTPVVIENKPGAGGALAATYTARAPADGYTLMMGGLGTNIFVPAISKSATFDGKNDFTLISYIGGPPVMFVAAADSPLNNLKDVVAAAKRQELVGYGSSGHGSVGHIVFEMFSSTAGIKVPHVPYNSASLTDVMTGRVPLGAFAFGSVLGQLEGGTLKILAVSSAERHPSFPNAPTIKEQGFDVSGLIWLAVIGPKGLPKDITDKLNNAIMESLKSDAVRKRLVTDGIAREDIPASRLGAFFDAEQKKWTPAVQALGVK